MSFFGKKRNDVIDLTRYAKKNVNNAPVRSSVEDGVLDLGSNPVSSSGSENTPSSDSPVSLGFLDNLGSSNQTGGNTQGWNTPSSSSGSITDNLREARRQKLKAAFTEMKKKIEDSEFKIGNLHRKINDMEERLRDVERRR